jgi:hypothetical protein
LNDNTPRQKQSFVDDYAGVYPLRIIRSQTISLLLLPNVLLLILAFADPYVPVWAWLLLVPLVMMDMLGLAVVVSPGRMQEFHLFVLGAVGILGSAAFAAAANKLAYATLGISSPWFLIVSAAGYILVFATLYGIHIKLLYGGHYSREASDNQETETRGAKKAQGIILACSGLGVLLSCVLIKTFGGYSMKVMLIIALLFLFALAYMMLAGNLHKYWLLKKRR